MGSDHMTWRQAQIPSSFSAKFLHAQRVAEFLKKKPTASL
jgi:hypothetical protein